MISFACQSINLRDIVTCSFELSKTEYELLLFLMEQEGPLTINAIAGKRGLERSTVQKAVSRLHEKELVDRRQLNLRSGGYRFIYEVQDKGAIKRRLTSIIDGWHRNVNDAVENW